MGPDWNTYAPVAREGLKYIFIAGVLCVLSLLTVNSWIPPAVFFIFAAFCVFFFRNPMRLIPVDPDAIVSPADGKIMIAESLTPTTTTHPKYKIAIFLSILDVHINRSPISGTVKKISYHPGTFALAYRAKESELNEKNDLHLEDDLGRKVTVTQIAGWVARRIVCYPKEHTFVNRGDRIGLIQFGSRVDLIIEGDIQSHIKVGDYVRGGSTILAHFTHSGLPKAVTP